MSFSLHNAFLIEFCTVYAKDSPLYTYHVASRANYGSKSYEARLMHIRRYEIQKKLVIL